MSNVDYVEIVKFEVLVYCWWDCESEFKLFYDINLLCVNWIDECVGLVGKKVFDIGCGGGIFSEVMVQCGVNVIGIDMGEVLFVVVCLYQLEFGVVVDYWQIIVEQMVEEMFG